MSKYEGKNILEVWDFRLSNGSPVLYADGDTWIVKVHAINPGNKRCVVLEEHDTKIPTTGNIHDEAAIAACYEWLRSVRDKHSRDHIEERKPIAKAINDANAKANAINAEALAAKAAGDGRLRNEKMGELQAHLAGANAVIKGLTAAFHANVLEGGAS